VSPFAGTSRIRFCGCDLSPCGAPRSAESSIGHVSGVARYDGVAEWYDRELATAPTRPPAHRVVSRLLGCGDGRLLDVGCGGGALSQAVAELGWRVTGVDISEDQLRLARERGLEVALEREYPHLVGLRCRR
jgi:2-polyprenyl-3-methyl-5-hydroxy-6-metoxy-1,4-benzoquinol methylase